MKRLGHVLAFGAFLLPGVTPAGAGDGWVQPVRNETVLKECGACHMAFQPAFLPARSWNRMADGLTDHFGEDASLAADTLEIIRTYLAANAGDVIRQGRAPKYMQWVAPGGTPQRITENPDFLRKHRFPDTVWKDPKVLTRSNCLACHRDAERGHYE
jgi:hypothetical protein